MSDEYAPVGRPETANLAEVNRALRRALDSGATVPAGRLWGLPEPPDGDCWVDMAGAAALAGTEPKTITSWIARGGPKACPFPAGTRYLYRLHWSRSVIMDWVERYREAQS